MEEPPAPHQVLVVLVVKRDRALRVQRRQMTVSDPLLRRAGLAKDAGEARINVAFAVDAGPEAAAVRLANRVCSGQRDHVPGTQSLARERRHEVGEARAGRREVRGSRLPARRPRVPPAEVHRPVWSSELQIKINFQT